MTTVGNGTNKTATPPPEKTIAPIEEINQDEVAQLELQPLVNAPAETNQFAVKHGPDNADGVAIITTTSNGQHHETHF